MRAAERLARVACVALLGSVLLTACPGAPEAGCKADADCAEGQACTLATGVCAAKEPAPFTLSAPAQLDLEQGVTSDLRVAITRSAAFSGDVTLTLKALPAGVSAAPVTIPGGESLGRLSVRCDGTAPLGSAEVTLEASAGGAVQRATFPVQVRTLSSLTVTLGGLDAAGTYTNGTLALRVDVAGGTAETVRLRKGSELLATLSGPPYAFTWDTRGEAEGSYAVTAEAVHGGQTFTSAARVVVVDRTSPTVAARAYEVDDANAIIATPATVTFSEPLAPATVTAASAQLAGAGVTWTPALSADGRVVTWTPSARPLAPASGTFALAGTLTDRAGNALAPASWSFTFPERALLGRGGISASPGATDARGVKVRASMSGTLYAAWIEPSGGADAVFVSTWNGTTWQMLGGALSALDGATPATELDLVVLPNGHPLVVWSEDWAQYRSRLHVREWTGSVWEARGSDLTRLSYTAFTSYPHFAVVGSELFLAWSDMDCGTDQNDVCFPTGEIRKWTGSAWAELTTFPLSHPNNSIGFGVDSQGRPVVVNTSWDGDSTRDWIAATLSRFTPAWSQWDKLAYDFDATSNNLSELQLVVDAVDSPVLAWREETATGARLYAARYSGSTFSLYPGTVNWNGDVADSPSLVLAPSGETVVAWSGLVSGQRRIGVSRLSGSGQWGQLGPSLDAVATPGTASRAPSATYAGSRLAVAWTESDGTAVNVYVAIDNT